MQTYSTSSKVTQIINRHNADGEVRHEFSLQWRHNGRDGVSNQQSRDCLLYRLFRRRSKKASKLRVTGLCAGNSPVTGEFPAQMASNAEMFPFDDVIMTTFLVMFDHIWSSDYVFVDKMTLYKMVDDISVSYKTFFDKISHLQWTTFKTKIMFWRNWLRLCKVLKRQILAIPNRHQTLSS